MSPAYPSDVTDAQWAIFAPWIPPAKLGGRPRRHPDRALINAMLYVLRGGIAWRALSDASPRGRRSTSRSVVGNAMGPGSA